MLELYGILLVFYFFFPIIGIFLYPIELIIRLLSGKKGVKNFKNNLNDFFLVKHHEWFWNLENYRKGVYLIVMLLFFMFLEFIKQNINENYSL